jgi:hypothetical protein
MQKQWTLEMHHPGELASALGANTLGWSSGNSLPGRFIFQTVTNIGIAVEQAAKNSDTHASPKCVNELSV